MSSSAQDRAERRDRPLLYAVGFLFLIGFWLLLANSTSRSEIVAGAIAAVLALVLYHVATGPMPKLRWPHASLLGLLELIGALVLEPFYLAHYLARHAVGAVQAPRVTKLSAPTADERFTDRALAVFLACLSSKSVVIDLPTETGEMLMHELEPQPVPRVVKELTRQ